MGRTTLANPAGGAPVAPPAALPAGEDKFRRVRLTNPAIQQRVAAFSGAVDFLLLAGFQKDESGEGLEMPEDKVGWGGGGGALCCAVAGF